MSEFVCTEIILNLPLRAVFAKMAWQSINLNTNLPLDCHEFARLRFANSRNDTTPKPLQKTQAHHKNFLFVIPTKSLSYWGVSRSIHKHFTLSYWAFARKRSIHKFKMQIYILKYGFFILNLKRILNSMDFSLAKLTQNDNGGFSLCAKAQNDKGVLSLQVDFLLWLRLASRLVATLKMTSVWDFYFGLRHAFAVLCGDFHQRFVFKKIISPHHKRTPKSFCAYS